MRHCVIACVLAAAMAAVPVSGQTAAGVEKSVVPPGGSAKLDVRIPQLIAYQGKLTDSTGRPVDDGSYVMVFSLSADSTGSSFWHETQTVKTNGGLFNILLGSNVPISIDAIPQGGCYLGIRVLPSMQEFHRQRIVSVPFAFQADNADKLQGRDTAAFDSLYISRTDTNAVTSVLIADGTISRADVASSFAAPYADTADYARLASDSARVAANSYLLLGKDTTALWNAKTLQGKDTTGFVRTGQDDAVTSAMIVPNTIVRADVATDFKAPLADTADYATAAPASDSAGVAGNSHLLQGKDTTGFLRTGQTDAVTSAMIVPNTIVRADVAPDFKAPFADTADYAVAAPASDSARVAGNSHLLQGEDTTALWNAKTLQGKDTSGFVLANQANSISSAMIADGTIARTDVAADFKAPFSDTADYAISAPASDSARVAANSHLLQTKDTTALWNAKTLQGRDSTGFVRTGQSDAVTSVMIVPNTIVRADVATDFKAPYSDTADYAVSAPASDSARVAGNSHLLQGEDTTALWNAKTLQGQDTAALWNAKTLQGKDTTGFVRTGQTDAVTSAMIAPNAIVRADVATDFKAPFADTADYAISAPASDSARVAGNSHLLQNRDTTDLWNAKTLQGKDTTALSDAKTLQGKDTTGFVRTGQADAVTSAMIVPNTIVRADVATGFKAPFADTADYAIAAPASDSARVAGNSHLLQGKDTTALWNAKTLQGKDTSGFVRSGQSDAVTSAMIVNGTIARADVATNFKAPYSDTADYAIAAPASDSARVAGNSYLLQGEDTTALWNAKTLQGRDTTGFVRTGQADAVTSAMIVPNTIVRADVAAGFKAPFADTADYAIAAPASDSARVAGNAHLLLGKDTTALWNAKTLQGKDTSGFVRTDQSDAVTSAMVVNGTIARADVAVDFKAPFSDTADYAIAAPASDSARVAGNAHLLLGKDTTALWDAKTLQGKDTSGFVRTDQASSVSSAMVVDGTIVRADVVTDFKAPYADTADYAIAAPASDSARVAGNSHLLQGKDTTTLWNAKTLQGQDTTALWNAKTLQGKDTSGFVRSGQSDAVTSAMIVNGTIARADVATDFKAPYSDTADYAIAAPASDSARVAGNSHLLQGKDTADLWNAKTLQGQDTVSLWNAKTLQGKDTTGFVRANQANSITNTMIVDGTVVRSDVATDFKAPYADTADFAAAAPASDSARVAGNSHLLQNKDTTDLWNAKTLQGQDTTALWDAKTIQGKDTTGFVRTGQVNSITTGMIVNGEVQATDIADANVTTAKIAAGAVDSTKIADGSVLGADIKNGTITSADMAASGVAAGTYGDGYHVARITVDSAGRLTAASDTTILGASPTGPAGGDLTGNYPNPAIATNVVTSAKILDGTIEREDVGVDFKAPYSDTADYAIAAPASDSARVAGNSHLLQGQDTTALWNAKTLEGQDTTALWNAKTLQGKDTTALSDAKTLQGKDTTGFVRTGQDDAVTSVMIVNGTVLRADVASDFKAPYSDTADYAISAPASDSARVAGNSHLLQGKDTADLWNAKTLQGQDTTALWNAKTLQGKDTTGFVRTSQPDAVTSSMIADGTIVRADVAGSFKAPYSDTADYAIAAPASDSARVAGNSHLLQGVDTTALWDAKTLQGKDTTGFVRTDQADAVTSAMIVPNTIVRADVAADFKAPLADTADYAYASPASDSAAVAANSHLLQGKDTADLWNAKTLQGQDTTALWNAKTLQGKDTTALDARYVNEDQAAGGDLTGTYPGPTIAANAVTLTKIARGGSADSGKAIVSQGAATDPAWGYPAAVGDSSPTVMKFLRFGAVVVDFPSVNGPATVETTATIAGARVGDQVLVFSSSNFDARFVLSATCSVTANDIIRLRACLPSNQTANPAIDTMRYIWIRP